MQTGGQEDGCTGVKQTDIQEDKKITGPCVYLSIYLFMYSPTRFSQSSLTQKGGKEDGWTSRHADRRTRR
jgi:hypothetical protein